MKQQPARQCNHTEVLLLHLNSHHHRAQVENIKEEEETQERIS
jgi:hypothetical protein